MKTTLDKLQEIQRRVFETTDNVSCCTSAHSTLGGFWTAAFHFWHCGDIAFSIYIGSTDDDIEHRLDMILKHGLFGRLKG